MREFFKQVFSEGGVGSFARVASAFTVAVSIVCLLYHTFHTGHAPDAMTSTGLATFGVAPYGASKAMNAAGQIAGGRDK